MGVLLCHVLIQQARDGVFYAGQTVQGTVKFTINKPTEYQAINLSLLGKGKFKWQDSDTDGYIAFNRKEDIVTIDTRLLTNRDSTKLYGSYEHPFHFQLPENIPMSYKTKTCTIRYRIQIKFFKDNLLNSSKKYHAEIPVYGYVAQEVEGPVTFGVDKSLFKLFSTKKHFIKLKAVLAKTCLTPGEKAELTLHLCNNTDEIVSVRVDLCSHITFIADEKRKTIIVEKVKHCSAVSPGFKPRFEVNFSLIIPTNGDLYTIISKVMKKAYMLRVEVVLPMPHRNAVVEMPVVIGERKGMELRSEDELNLNWRSMMEDLDKE